MRNWRTDPDIMAAREFAQKRRAGAVIVIALDADHVKVCSYGINGPICHAVGKLADAVHEHVMKQLTFEQHNKLCEQLRASP